MPIYEYICEQCGGRFSKLVAGFSDPAGLSCPRCQATAVRRAVSRVAVLRSEEARMDAMADPGLLAGLDENDPAAVARWAKKMGKEMGEDMGEDWDSMVDEMLEDEMNGGEGGAAPGDDLGWG